MKMLLRNGRVFDPGRGLDDVLDVHISAGAIQGVGKNLKVPKIQWLTEHLPCTILKPDTKVEGICEPATREASTGSLIQFERYGFARLEKKEDKLTFIYTHK